MLLLCFSSWWGGRRGGCHTKLRGLSHNIQWRRGTFERKRRRRIVIRIITVVPLILMMTMMVVYIVVIVETRVGKMSRAVAFHQIICPRFHAGCNTTYELSCLVLYCAPKHFSPGTTVFPSHQNPTYDLTVLIQWIVTYSIHT